MINYKEKLTTHRELYPSKDIETTVERNLKLYQYVGFEIYHHWYDAKEDLNVWFLKREVSVARHNLEKAGKIV